MILLDQSDQLLLIRQTDHALLSGFFAREWGNGLFAAPAAFDSFCLAASEHDNGWAEWEATPQIDPKTRLPYSFMSIPTEEHMALYQRGIGRVVAADPYAGLLVCMHCAGLYDRARATLPGYSAKYVKSQESAAVGEFLQRLKLQQLRLKSDLRAHTSTKALVDDGSVERNSRLLEVLDRLSLYFCLNVAEDATLEDVPLGDVGGEVDCQLRHTGDGFSLEPYAFRKDPLVFSILARRVPKRPYGDVEDFQRMLSRAPFFALNFKLCSTGFTGEPQTRVAAA